MSDLETALQQLAHVAQKQKDIEATVLWHGPDGWSDATGETLEAEEIAFYAEGLLLEGFSLAWDHIDEPGLGDHIRLCFWQGSDPALPGLPLGSSRLAGGQIRR